MRKMKKMALIRDFWTTCLVCPRPQISEFTFKSVIKHTEFLVNQFLSYQQWNFLSLREFLAGVRKPV